MTGLLLSCLVFGQTPPSITYGEESHRDLKGTAVVATISAGEMNALDYGQWQLLGAILLDGASSYTRRSIYSFGSQNGPLPDVLVWPGVMQIRFEAPPTADGVRVIADLLATIIKSPSLPDTSLEFAVRRGRDFTPTVWDRVMDPFRPKAPVATPLEIKKLYSETFRHESLSIHVAGPLEQGSVQSLITPRFSDWRVRTLPRLQTADRRPPAPQIVGEQCLTVWESEPKKNLYDVAAQMVAVCAIGGGKSSLLHSIVRQKNRWGYQQEAILVPGKKGWQIKVFTVQPKPDDPALRAEEMKSALQEGVAGWKEEDVVRAKQIATASLAGTNPVPPFWLTSSARLDTSPMARASFMGWSRIYGTDVTISKIQAALDSVSLDDMKSLATQILESKPSVQLFD